MADEQDATEKRARHRSPGYPTVGLREAVDRVRKLYDTDGKAGAPVDVAAKHIGFSAAHGQAHSVLSALKKFGLVAGGGGRIVPTQRAIEILKLPETDPRRLQALKDAAMSPSIYRELVEHYGETGLPSNDALEAEIEVDRGFNPNAVSGFVKDFRESLEFAGITEFSTLESDSEYEEAMDSSAASTEEKPNLRESLVKKIAQRQQTIAQISTPVGSEDGQVIFAHVHFDGAIKKEFVASLKKYLDYLEGTLQ